MTVFLLWFGDHIDDVFATKDAAEDRIKSYNRQHRTPKTDFTIEERRVLSTGTPSQ